MSSFVIEMSPLEIDTDLPWLYQEILKYIVEVFLYLQGSGMIVLGL